VSDAQTTDPTAPATAADGDVSAESGYTPRQIVDDDLGGSFADAVDATLVSVEDGAMVTGTVVRVDRDEVLLDIGYKSEGVIPSRELSIRNDVDPNEVVRVGDQRTRTAGWSCRRSGPSTSAPGATSSASRRKTASSPAP
jgi:small subunit ribosomal protein S1